MFPNEIEKEFLVFLYNYNYLRTCDAKFLFNTIQYYKREISSLIKNDYIKKHDSGTYILSDTGKSYLKSLGYDFSSKMPYTQKYIERQTVISYIGAFYHYSKNIQFIPSFKLKDKEVFTIRSRRFIGELKINQKPYLVYYIPKNQTRKYVESIFYDIQKEQYYKNIIIFTEDMDMIKLNDFCFGLKEVLVIESNIENLEKIKYMNKVDWSKIIKKKYGNSVFLSEYNFCDYTNKKSKYVSCFYFIDTEKINLIKYFLKENEYKEADIICNRDILDKIKQELPDQNYVVVDLEQYTKGEFNIYE